MKARSVSFCRRTRYCSWVRAARHSASVLAGVVVGGCRLVRHGKLGLRNVAFEVADLDAILDRLAADGYGLVGGVGQYEQMWRMAYVRGTEGITVALAQRIG